MFPGPVSEAKSFASSSAAASASREFTREPKLSYGASGSGNGLYHGENLATLARLEPLLRGTVRCIYIDPPYNNQERYAHYHDARSHSEWLAAIVQRIERLAPLLREDGTLWISIDDREVHYLKVAVDAVFGRENFVSTIIWQQRTTRENRKVFSNNHEYLLVYAKDAKGFRQSRNQLAPTPEMLSRYKNPDQDPRGLWQSVSANVQAGHATASQFYLLAAPNGRRHAPPNGRCWIYSERKMQEEIRKNNVWFGKDGNGTPRLKRFLSESSTGLTPETFWPAVDVGTNDLAKKHLLQLFPNETVFDTPKPEALIHRILHIATNPGELVLDAYLGSGTTAAVAHKMRRKYIGIEEGSQAVSHCASRLKKVVDGEAGGVSAAVGWKGGGGFDFYRLSR
ncbi:site-specific DNA-methyltransferase [Corallococcus sp. AS-1-12]|uniref:site-specific DNA-methyltransferase n=1 Tax=Corallococcus sp. AS-1-12 TaxID=2874598 RepID=UPI001CBC4AAD|nr:site-specific DNA-methyltransferase [Corallococcus sp. AS-1-12]MBZ4330521.1 site-specific DNA-methyltransferase [Corallococcus sp. AS-1-12]